MSVTNYRRPWATRENVRKFRRLVSKEARRKVYPNRRSPYSPLTACIHHLR
jgi:hypothetical protein